ncbi:hypothetical protein V6N13_075862 [Hibiscus sabdariffa]|uniref:Uncharacterized protein n=1 Tax=Hibiscus sabdariffa TaxID=183260 RepID=A0ABR2UCU2_9ROSI
MVPSNHVIQARRHETLLSSSGSVHTIFSYWQLSLGPTLVRSPLYFHYFALPSPSFIQLSYHLPISLQRPEGSPSAGSSSFPLHNAPLASAETIDTCFASS